MEILGGTNKRKTRLCPQMADACKAGPANGVGHKNGGHTKCQPGALNGGHSMVRMELANGFINGIDKCPHKGAGFPRIMGVSRLSVHHKLMGIDGTC
jgi:hypothetical protein